MFCCFFTIFYTHFGRHCCRRVQRHHHCPPVGSFHCCLQIQKRRLAPPRESVRPSRELSLPPLLLLSLLSFRWMGGWTAGGVGSFSLSLGLSLSLCLSLWHLNPSVVALWCLPVSSRILLRVSRMMMSQLMAMHRRFPRSIYIHCTFFLSFFRSALPLSPYLSRSQNYTVALMGGVVVDQGMYNFIRDDTNSKNKRTHAPTGLLRLCECGPTCRSVGALCYAVSRCCCRRCCCCCEQGKWFSCSSPRYPEDSDDGNWVVVVQLQLLRSFLTIGWRYDGLQSRTFSTVASLGRRTGKTHKNRNCELFTIFIHLKHTYAHTQHFSPIGDRVKQTKNRLFQQFRGVKCYRSPI